MRVPAGQPPYNHINNDRDDTVLRFEERVSRVLADVVAEHYHLTDLQRSAIRRAAAQRVGMDGREKLRQLSHIVREHRWMPDDRRFDVDEVIREFRERIYAEPFGDDEVMWPNVLTAALARETGATSAGVTNAEGWRSAEIFKALELDNLNDRWIGSEDVAAAAKRLGLEREDLAKPRSWPHQAGARGTDVDPREEFLLADGEALAQEDSDIGLLSATRAGADAFDVRQWDEQWVALEKRAMRIAGVHDTDDSLFAAVLARRMGTSYGGQVFTDRDADLVLQTMRRIVGDPKPEINQRPPIRGPLPRDSRGMWRVYRQWLDPTWRPNAGAPSEPNR